MLSDQVITLMTTIATYRFAIPHVHISTSQVTACRDVIEMTQPDVATNAVRAKY
jgi:biotin synthase-like enzyme